MMSIFSIVSVLVWSFELNYNQAIHISSWFLLDCLIVPAQVRLHLLTAVMKCFFKRPPETQKALGAALAAGIADFHQVHVCPNDFFPPLYLSFVGVFQLGMFN